MCRSVQHFICNFLSSVSSDEISYTFPNSICMLCHAKTLIVFKYCTFKLCEIICCAFFISRLFLFRVILHANRVATVVYTYTHSVDNALKVCSIWKATHELKIILVKFSADFISFGGCVREMKIAPHKLIVCCFYGFSSDDDSPNISTNDDKKKEIITNKWFIPE